MTADDSLVLLASEDRLDEAELAEAALQGVQLLVADPSRVGGIRTEEIDRDLLDDQGGQGSLDAHLGLPSKVLVRLAETVP